MKEKLGGWAETLRLQFAQSGLPAISYSLLFFSFSHPLPISCPPGGTVSPTPLGSPHLLTSKALQSAKWVEVCSPWTTFQPGG